MRQHIPKYTIPDLESAKEVASDFDAFIMPDEDVSHIFADKVLEGRDVSYVNVFLRYDSKRTTTEFEPDPDEIVTSSEFPKRIIGLCR